MSEIKFKPYDGARPFVFVSYSHMDNVVLDTIGLLQQRKYRIWYDNGIHSGESWSDEIVKKIKSATAFVVFLSKNSVASRNVQSEVSLAFKRQKLKLIPIWIEPASELDSNMEYFLSATQVAFQNITKKVTPEELVNELDVSIPDSTRDSAVVEEGVLYDTQDDIHDLMLGSDIVEIAPRACKSRVNLTKIVFSKSLRKIGDEAFRGCTSITELFINREIRKIGDSCFRDCVSLRKLTIQEEIEIGERAFENCGRLEEVILPDDLSEIYSGVFNSCRNLKKIHLPKDLIAIGDNAFAYCDSLEKITIPNNVVRIDDQVFGGCTSLKEIIIPESVSRIGKNVFKDCSSLESINIPSSVRKIEAGCFRGCSSLKAINVDLRNKYLKSMNGILFNKNKSTLICYPTCNEEEVYEVPDSVCDIEDWAFANANNLKRVVIPDSVERIGEGAFFRCENLRELFIPYSVTIIHDTAFRGCTNLTDVFIESTSFKDIGWGLFYRCENVTVHCISADVENYCKRLNIKCVRYGEGDY